MELRWLKRQIRISKLRNSKLYHTFRFELHKAKYVADIKRFKGTVSLDTVSCTLKQMKSATINYHWNSEEFFLFDYIHLSDAQRREFVCEYEKNVFCDQVNNSKDADVFYNKWNTYEVFNEFFKRDVVLVSSNNDIDKKDVQSFLKKHFSFIMKPVDAACGKGIQMVRATSEKEAIEKLKNIIESIPNTYIVEELIVQVPEMASFHPQSVNTLRIPTINYGNEVDVIRPFVRIGQGGSFVDNAGSGGVFGEIDIETGIVIAACDELGNKYLQHPDTHKQIVGTKIPSWREAMDVAKKLATVLPRVVYVGWDLALTDKGWVLVEGNDKGQFVFQYTQGKGFAKELEQIKKRLGM